MKLKKQISLFLALIIVLFTLGCTTETSTVEDTTKESHTEQTTTSINIEKTTTATTSAETETIADTDLKEIASLEENASAASSINKSEITGTNISDISDISSIPEYNGMPYVTVNNNIPVFSDSDMMTKSFETYGSLDSLGRCTTAFANVGKDTMPTEKRGSIGSVKPTGWHTIKYDCVDGKYLYNRCHLIGYQLTAENANKKNLITGTRYLNVDGMLPFENMVADYIKETGNHVLYRVKPIFEGNNLLASGVQMEAKSVEDNGDGILFNVYCFNAQPGVRINYATGDSQADDSIKESKGAIENVDNVSQPEVKEEAQAEPQTEVKTEPPVTRTEAPAPVVEAPVSNEKSHTYILNKNTKKFHIDGCSSVKRMSEKNKLEYSGTRSEVINMGYEPCQICNP